MHSQANSMRTKKGLFSVTLTKSQKYSMKKWVTSGKISSKINNYKLLKSQIFSKNIKILLKQINLLLHRPKQKKQKSFCMIALRNYSRHKVIWTNSSKRVKIFHKELSSSTKLARKWIKDAANLFDFYTLILTFEF